MPQKPSPIERLRASGRRMTRERELLVRIIDRNPHLDAAEIYRIARRKRPRIGLATVYRTLNLLEQLGVVRASELGETHSHYEVRQDDHLHLVCSECGVRWERHKREPASCRGDDVADPFGRRPDPGRPPRA